MLALLVALVAFVPWKDLVLRHNEYQAIKYDFAGVVTNSKKQARSPATWHVNTDYSRKKRTLQLHLSHLYDLPADDFWLFAEFTSYLSAEPVVRTVLSNLSGGSYRSDDLQLTRGNWLMNVTGVHRSEFKFRIEQPLRVD